MQRPLADLIHPTEHAWPLVRSWLDGAKNRPEILPTTRAQGEATLHWLQVTTRSPMGAIALESGGVVFLGGLVRLLGADGPRMAGSLRTWADVQPRLQGAMIVAHDAMGGFFVCNGGAFGARVGTVLYSEPETLGWFDTECSYSEFVQWLAAGDLDGFYAQLTWPRWEQTIAALPHDRGISVAPPLWTACPSDERSRRDVPMTELWGVWNEFRRQIRQ